MTDVLERLRTALADRYAIERELGQGGMATVYLAQDLKHHRKVALKVMRPELTATAERFLREITIAANLQHPNILPVHDSGEVEGLLYYVMPYVEGESLRSRLSRERQLPITDAVRILRDVVDGLAHAHQHGVLHRDVKPENIMLSGRHALVADFGVAKAIAEGATTVTTVGVALGTPAYMAPEQALADPDVDHRADIYAVGVVAYECLTGELPVRGATPQAVMAAQVTATPQPIGDLRPDVPPRLATLVTQCMAKRPADRPASLGEVLAELETLATPSGGMTPVAGSPAVLRWARRRAAPLLAAAVVAVAVIGWWGVRSARRSAELRWARNEAIPEILRLAEQRHWVDAFLLTRRAARVLPDDSATAALWRRSTGAAWIRTDPPGARVLIRKYRSIDTSWTLLGVTPLDSVRFPFEYVRLRIEKAGFRPFDGTGGYYYNWVWSPRTIVLDRREDGDSAPSDPVRVPADSFAIHLPGLDSLKPIALGGFLIDRYEVTNRQFKAFVDSGGYERPEFWDQPFVLDGRTLTFGQAVSRFVDRTGRRGPATWEAGSYPAGQAEYPVTGVSWYEAAAYARFDGRDLPTIYHWVSQAETWASQWIVPASNFSGAGPAPVGRYDAPSRYGTYDMGGNAREWCLNEAAGGNRYILGGGWNDPPYAFNDAFSQAPFDRSPTNGFRLVTYLERDSTLRYASRRIERAFRDYRKERPVSDAIFAVYRRQFDYDPTPLNTTTEEVDSTAEDWIRERVAFDAAYGERMFAHLYLPRAGEPPYQAVVYYPGSDAIHTRSSEGRSVYVGGFDFLLRAGRAVILPIFKSTYERSDSLDSDYANESNFYKEHVIVWVKDLKRSIDYLGTRSEIDTTRLAYFGFSWGGFLGGLIPAVEPRLKAVVLHIAGLEMERSRPEVDPFNYLPRIRVPVLMLNGEYDHFFPVETSQRPMFELLGTPPDQKRWLVFPGGHNVPRAELVAEILKWLDRFLGPVAERRDRRQ